MKIKRREIQKHGEEISLIYFVHSEIVIVNTFVS